MYDEKYKKIKNVLLIILVLNFAVAIAKIIVGSIINSESMTADGFHSLSDGSSNIIGLIGISFASKPIDKDHPYGHKKYETLTGLFIFCMLVFLGLKIITDSFVKFQNPSAPNISLESIAVMIATLAINLFVTNYEHKRGVELDSTILISDAMHTKSDVYVTIGVLITLLAVKFGADPIIDPIASTIVAAFIFHAAYEIFKSSSNILVDGSVIESEIIEKIALSNEKVLGVHKIRSRGTQDDIYVDMHILADPHLSLEECHNLMHEIESDIRNSLNRQVQVIIHIEPDESIPEEIKKQ